MKIAEAIKSEFAMHIAYRSRSLFKNDSGDGFEVVERQHYARRAIVLYIGQDEDSAVAALLGDDHTDDEANAYHAMTGE